MLATLSSLATIDTKKLRKEIIDEIRLKNKFRSSKKLVAASGFLQNVIQQYEKEQKITEKHKHQLDYTKDRFGRPISNNIENIWLPK